MSDYNDNPDPLKELRDELLYYMHYHPDPHERQMMSQLLDLLIGAELEYERRLDEARMGNLPQSSLDNQRSDEDDDGEPDSDDNNDEQD